jgi:hypothetical protein
MIIIAFHKHVLIKYALNAVFCLLPFVTILIVKAMKNVFQTTASMVFVQDVQTYLNLSATVSIVLTIAHASLVSALIINVILVQLNKVFNAIINPAIIIPYVLVIFVIRVFAFHVMTMMNLTLLYAVDYLAIQMFSVVLEPA